MDGVLLVKPGVEFTVISPGGFRILGELEYQARAAGRDLTITSACDGVHSGPNDPHKLGKAYDIRSKDQPDKLLVLDAIMDDLGRGAFYGFLEDEGTENEHFHIQVREGVDYP